MADLLVPAGELVTVSIDDTLYGGGAASYDLALVNADTTTPPRR